MVALQSFKCMWGYNFSLKNTAFWLVPNSCVVIVFLSGVLVVIWTVRMIRILKMILTAGYIVYLAIDKTKPVFNSYRLFT